MGGGAAAPAATHGSALARWGTERDLGKPPEISQPHMQQLHMRARSYHAAPCHRGQLASLCGMGMRNARNQEPLGFGEGHRGRGRQGQGAAVKGM